MRMRNLAKKGVGLTISIMAGRGPLCIKIQSQSVSTPTVIGNTSLPKRFLSYRWVINDAHVFLKNINAVDHDTQSHDFFGSTGSFKSPEFEVNLPLREVHRSISKWKLMIMESSSSFSLYLKSSGHDLIGLSRRKNTETEAPSTILISDCIFSILDSSTNEVKHSATVAARQCVIGVQMEDFGIADFIKKGELTKYLDGHTLTLQVDATLLCLTDHSECVETSNTLVPADDIRKGIKRLYKDDSLTDVTITCGGKEFRAHKVILASQSPVFKKMFEIDMKEKRSGVIEVPDITPAVMSDLLAYLYTGTAPHVDTLARELLNVADKYELPRLLSICETTLVSKITAKSVLEMLILAELHKTETLKNACLGFIKCNFAHISKLDSWKDMKASASHQNLVFEVLESNQQGYSTPKRQRWSD